MKFSDGQASPIDSNGVACVAIIKDLSRVRDS